MNDINLIVSQNLVKLRKKSNLTQAQLAEKLNYSDKSISKWEKGESIPSVSVLMQIADFYKVKIQDIVYPNKSLSPQKSKIRERSLVSLLLTMSVWLVATILFVVFNFLSLFDATWLCFIVAIPVSFFVLSVVFFRWKNILVVGILLSFFIWTAILAINLCLSTYQTWMIYLIGCPLQLIIIFACGLYYLRKRTKE